MEPMVKLVLRDLETFEDPFQGGAFLESFRKDTEDKEKAIAKVRDNQIRKDGMGMPTAFADQPEDGHFRSNRGAMDKVNDMTQVVGMDLAVAGGSAGGACFLIRTERVHEGIKEKF